MERFEKIAEIGNEIEAMCLRGELEERGIPHAFHSHYDLAYDGLFQFSSGWGHVEAPSRYRDAILDVLSLIRQPARQDVEDDEAANSGG
jgi:hypothetical protein